MRSWPCWCLVALLQLSAVTSLRWSEQQLSSTAKAQDGLQVSRSGRNWLHRKVARPGMLSASSWHVDELAVRECFHLSSADRTTGATPAAGQQ